MKNDKNEILYECTYELVANLVGGVNIFLYSIFDFFTLLMDHGNT